MPKTITVSVSTRGKPAGTMTFHKPRIKIGSDKDMLDADSRSDGEDYLYLEDDKAEHTHAEMFLLEKEAWILDEYSSDGTKVNGKSIRLPERIRKGDTIALGKSVVIVEKLDLDATIDLEAWEPRYVSMKVLDKCPHCGSGLPVNGLMDDVPCGACHKTMKIGPKYWTSVLEDADNDWEEGEGAFTLNAETNVEWKATEPRCPCCDAALQASRIRIGTKGEVQCPACNAATTTYPPPSWLREAMPSIQQVYCGETQEQAEQGTTAADDASSAAAASSATASAAAQDKPVVMSCPSCSGAVKVNRRSDRTVTCEFCNADVFLPDELWRRLHPVKTKSAWYIRFQGPSGNTREADEEAASEFKETAEKLEKDPPRKPIGKLAKLGEHLGFLPIAIPVVVGLFVLYAWVKETYVDPWDKPLVQKSAQAGGTGFSIKVPEGFVERKLMDGVGWSHPDSLIGFSIEVHASSVFPASIREAVQIATAGAAPGLQLGQSDDVQGSYIVVLKDAEDKMLDVQLFRPLPGGKQGALLCHGWITTDQSRDFYDIEDGTAYLTEVCTSMTSK